MITFDHLNGIGVNVRYAVMRGGVRVATIHRSGRSTFLIDSVHYGETLGRYVNINRARAAAIEIDYPDAWAIYEKVCQRVESNRRAWYERNINGKIFEAVRDLANGSNSAHMRLIEMVAEIETFAKDRTATSTARRDWALANNTYIYDEPTYPEPPAGDA